MPYALCVLFRDAQANEQLKFVLFDVRIRGKFCVEWNERREREGREIRKRFKLALRLQFYCKRKSGGKLTLFDLIFALCVEKFCVSGNAALSSFYL